MESRVIKVAGFDIVILDKWNVYLVYDNGKTWVTVDTEEPRVYNISKSFQEKLMNEFGY
jgi:hypothetical protein